MTNLEKAKLEYEIEYLSRLLNNLCDHYVPHLHLNNVDLLRKEITDRLSEVSEKLFG